MRRLLLLLLLPLPALAQSTVICTSALPGTVVGSCISGTTTASSFIGTSSVCSVGATGSASSVCLNSTGQGEAEGETADGNEFAVSFPSDPLADSGVAFETDGAAYVSMAVTPTNAVLSLLQSLYVNDGTKTLTESAATSFVPVDVASGARTGGIVYYCLNAADATDHQERCGSVPFAVVVRLD